MKRFFAIMLIGMKVQAGFLEAPLENVSASSGLFSKEIPQDYLVLGAKVLFYDKNHVPYGESFLFPSSEIRPFKLEKEDLPRGGQMEEFATPTEKHVLLPDSNITLSNLSPLENILAQAQFLTDPKHRQWSLLSFSYQGGLDEKNGLLEIIPLARRQHNIYKGKFIELTPEIVSVLLEKEAVPWIGLRNLQGGWNIFSADQVPEENEKFNIVLESRKESAKENR